MSYTLISIIILLIILATFIFINFDYSSKYKKTDKDLYYEALDQLLIGKLKESYSTLRALIKNDTNNVIEFNNSLKDDIEENKKRSFWNLLKKE